MDTRTHLPANLFHTSPEQRTQLARQRFFEDGLRPSGMVSEAVIQSWARCLRRHPNPNQPAVFDAVTTSRVHTALRSNRELLAAADDELQRLRVTLSGTTSTAMLTDPEGVIIGTSFTQARGHEQLMPITARVGINLAEEAVGTTAPGITARSGQACTVLGSEHFFGNVGMMHCAAAPIRDVRGKLAGVLDLSSEGMPFGFDASAVVSHFAAEIENRLLCAQSTEHLVVRLQIAPALLDTPMVAMCGVKGDGRIDWFNAAAARLLGLPPQGRGVAPWVEDCLGLSAEALFAMSTRPEARVLLLPNGLTLWARFEWRSVDRPRAWQPSAALPAAAPAASGAQAAPQPKPESRSLRETEREAVARVLADCGGNISRAARVLGVSRGLVYRHVGKGRS